MVELTLSHLVKTLALQEFCTDPPVHLGALLRFAPRWAPSVERPAGLRMTKGTGTLRTSSFAELAPSSIVELADRFITCRVSFLLTVNDSLVFFSDNLMWCSSHDCLNDNHGYYNAQ